MYLTPDRFRSMGFGVDLDSVDNVEIRSVLSRASAAVDTYCAVSLMPTKHQFFGGTITGEQHQWRLANLDTYVELGSRRVYPYHRPIKTVTDFRVKFTNTYDVAIAPANLYVNNSEGWCEVVSLAAVVTGIYPIGINFGLYTPVAEMSYTYGFDFAVVGEVLEDTDAQTYRALNGFWDSTIAPKVYIDGAVQSSGYSIDYTEGTVFFTNAPTAANVITVDYTYTLPTPIAQATGLMAQYYFGERELAAKGMTGINVLEVAEVQLRRQFRDTGSKSSPIPMDVAVLLDPFVERTAR